MVQVTASQKQIIELGFKEWCALPELGITNIKAKLDTGARTSALQASNIRYKVEGGETYVYFECHPIRRNKEVVIHCKAKLLEKRQVKNSSGAKEKRPVIQTCLCIAGKEKKIEITLTDRKKMQMRMLLGRQALSKLCLINCSKTMMSGKKSKEDVLRSYKEEH